MAAGKHFPLARRKVVAALLRDRGDALVVTGLGSPTWDVYAAGDTPSNFYLWGGMGGAVMLGLGLALAQPRRRVLVVTGDGEMLMGIGALATVAAQRVANLSIVTIDNEHYGETGMQTTHTGEGADLAAIAKASGIDCSATIRTQTQLTTWIPRLYSERGTVFVAVKVNTDPVPLRLPPRDGTWLRARFREALLGESAHE